MPHDIHVNYKANLLRSMCSRWNMHFKWAIEKGQNVICLSHELEGEEEFVANHIHEWDIHWKAMNASFEEALNTDEDL
jgi:hypothetical protein